MDIDRLSVRIAEYSVKNDNTTFLFHITVEYGHLRWTVKRRYSEFDKLRSNLRSLRLTALPQLPPKTLFRPQNFTIIQDRITGLQVFLFKCLQRPDIRSSAVFLQFICFEEQTGVSVSSVTPEILCSALDPKFAVSSIAYDTNTQLLFVSQEEASNLARLGRAWALVEADEFGAVAVFLLQMNTEKRELELRKLPNVPFSQRVRCLAYIPSMQVAMAGGARGVLYSFHLPVERCSLENFKLVPLEPNLPLHQSEMIVAMDAVDSIQFQLPGGEWSCTTPVVLTVGFDLSIRILELHRRSTVDPPAHSWESGDVATVSVGTNVEVRVVAGGRLSSRVGKGEHLVLGRLLVVPGHRGLHTSRLAILGSSDGQILAIDVTEHTEFLFAQHVPNFEAVCGMALSTADNILVVSHQTSMSFFNLKPLMEFLGHPSTPSRTLQQYGQGVQPAQLIPLITTISLEEHHTKALNSRAVSLSYYPADPPLTTRPRVYTGHAGGSVSLFELCWKQNNSGIHTELAMELLMSWRAHNDDPFGRANVMAVQVLPDAEAHLLLSGASEGVVHLWRMPPEEQMRVWRPSSDPLEKATLVNTADGSSSISVGQPDAQAPPIGVPPPPTLVPGSGGLPFSSWTAPTPQTLLRGVSPVAGRVTTDPAAFLAPPLLSFMPTTSPPEPGLGGTDALTTATSESPLPVRLDNGIPDILNQPGVPVASPFQGVSGAVKESGPPPPTPPLTPPVQLFEPRTRFHEDDDDLHAVLHEATWQRRNVVRQ